MKFTSPIVYLALVGLVAARRRNRSKTSTLDNLIGKTGSSLDTYVKTFDSDKLHKYIEKFTEINADLYAQIKKLQKSNSEITVKINVHKKTIEELNRKLSQ